MKWRQLLAVFLLITQFIFAWMVVQTFLQKSYFHTSLKKFQMSLLQFKEKSSAGQFFSLSWFPYWISEAMPMLDQKSFLPLPEEKRDNFEGQQFCSGRQSKLKLNEVCRLSKLSKTSEFLHNQFLPFSIA